MAKVYPIHVDVNLHITNGRDDGVVKFVFGLSKLPTEANIQGVIEKLELPKGFRLMTRHESMMYFMREEKGYVGTNNIAMPRLPDGDEWHDPETANVYMASDEDQYAEEEM